MSSKRSGFVAWPPGPPRTIFINEPLPDYYYDRKHKIKKEHVYHTNQVITSKYTILTFIPRNLLEQFRRIANIFFAVIAILQFFNKFSTISPGLVILPLIFIWGLTGLKDGYEDIKRHQSDRRVNYSEVRVLSGGGWENPNRMSKKSKTFVPALPRRIGRSKRRNKNGADDGLNADIEMLGHDAPPEAIDMSQRAQTVEHPDVEYDNDGSDPDRPHWKRMIWEDVRVGDIIKLVDHESLPADVLICATSEDENVAFVETKNLDGETNLKSRNANVALTHMSSAAACADSKNAFQLDCDRPEPHMHKLNAAVVMNDERTPIDLQMTMLRGTVLRNTAWVIGIVMYTGTDTKLVLNSGGTPSKRSKVERQMNPMVFINLIILAIMAVALAIVDSSLERHYYPRGAPWLFDDNRSDDNPSINGLVTWAFALITFQNIVPISLYISIEVVRTCQAAFIYFDKEIWYDKTDQPTFARSWNLADDLGQIEYIFSDKTGTLTQNAMVFRRCSIGGIVYRGDEDAQEEEVLLDRKSAKSDQDLTPRVSATSGETPSTPDDKIPEPVVVDRVKLPGGVLHHFKDSVLSAEIGDAAETGKPGERERLGQFFTVLALCHTVLAAVDPRTGALEYKAQSPDEAALVQAAADVGFEFRGRDRDVLFLQTPFESEPVRYRLHNILDFTSARKRMSVILQRIGEDDEGDGGYMLLSKGADNVIFERLRKGAEDLKAKTELQLDEFASEGLRTLTLAYRMVGEEEYAAWRIRYAEATASVDGREDQIEKVSDEIEQGLILLGATAIEDRLQDGVPETIADLKKAGIKIWVATGDKLETAIAIGHSTNLIGSDSNIIIIRGHGDEGRSIYSQMLHAVEEYFPHSGLLDDPLIHTDELDGSMSSRRNSHQMYPLHRVQTGVSSIVGTDNGHRPGGYVLVIDGLALTDTFSDEKHKHLLLNLATICEAVVCCRVSPKQKALVVKLVKEGLGSMTLAIGDGANDVSMIQAADVGVGISGEEGLQAVNASDYAIGQFRFLKRLLLVHGHWSYARNGNMIVNFFYKNIICIGVLWWFQIYCGWSSAYAFEYTYLLFWNSFWTLCPVIAVGIFDRIVDDHVLMALPELYRYGREGKWFGMKLFSAYMIDGIVQSAVIFFLLLYGYFSPTVRDDGFDVAQYEFATTMAISAVMAANLYNGLNTNVWTGWVFFAVLIGIVLIWAYTAIYSIISPGWFVTPVYGNDHFLFHSALFWLGLPITVLLALAPMYLYKAWNFGFNPNDVEIMRWNHKLNPRLDIVNEAHMRIHKESIDERPMVLTHPYGARPSASAHASQIDMATGLRSQSRGFNFATEENGVEMRRMQSNLSGRSPLPSIPEHKRRSLLQSIRRPLRRKKPPTLLEPEEE
ncbi:hypothetical protein EW146_g4435 [Bondarzewia mesenterica]|uniref:Phospholipid-transporting ATPase n=1 Tax=Bondarzewia mesenterica TaxID=1095465 RepID=A0A4S4LUI3_9AGAM|nr:hypothetical protein EW146_g4435 [Bondarzewia mesenterica]